MLVLKGHSASVLSLAYAPDGKLLASGSRDWKRDPDTGVVKLWDTTTGQGLATLRTGLQEHGLGGRRGAATCSQHGQEVRQESRRRANLGSANRPTAGRHQG